jgi:hypothetical protein
VQPYWIAMFFVPGLLVEFSWVGNNTDKKLTSSGEQHGWVTAWFCILWSHWSECLKYRLHSYCKFDIQYGNILPHSFSCTFKASGSSVLHLGTTSVAGGEGEGRGELHL